MSSASSSFGAARRREWACPCCLGSSGGGGCGGGVVGCQKSLAIDLAMRHGRKERKEAKPPSLPPTPSPPTHTTTHAFHSHSQSPPTGAQSRDLGRRGVAALSALVHALPCQHSASTHLIHHSIHPMSLPSTRPPTPTRPSAAASSSKKTKPRGHHHQNHQPHPWSDGYVKKKRAFSASALFVLRLQSSNPHPPTHPPTPLQQHNNRATSPSGSSRTLT